jgi:hypothetical protein
MKPRKSHTTGGGAKKPAGKRRKKAVTKKQSSERPKLARVKKRLPRERARVASITGIVAKGEAGETCTLSCHLQHDVYF